MATANTVAPRKINTYGWRPDTPDQRDHLFLSEMVNVDTLPKVVDLRPTGPPHLDQGQLGSCTAHGSLGAFRELLIKSGTPDIELARLQLYYDTRAVEGTIQSDAGGEIRDVIKCLAKTGVAPETLWPYDITKFSKRPPAPVYKAARADLAVQYLRVAVSATAIKQALSQGFPVIIGISVYQSFESDEVARTGIVPIPAQAEQQIGGHCMYVVGYGQKPGYFTVRNSWGNNWGDGGDCYIPEAYLGNPNMGSDYWILQKVTHG